MPGSKEQPVTDPRPDTTWRHRLWEPCDIASVVFFRVAIAVTLLAHVVYVFRTGWIEHFFGGSLGSERYHLKFYGFEWVDAFGGEGMRRVHLLMGLAAVGVGLGLFYRLSAVLLFVTFTYTFLSEATLYQNHYYMICLVAFLLTLIPAHRSCSLDALLFPGEVGPFIPNWCRWVLMFVVALPYTFGGIAKLNGDWLHALPLSDYISQKSDLPIIGQLLAEPWTPWVLSYGGLLFDLSIVPLLLWRRTRLAAYVAAVLFHLMNSVLFHIDVFPWMMMALTTIYFAPDWPRRLLRRPPRTIPAEAISASHSPSPMQRFTLGVVGVFVVWQLVLPWRHMAYPGDASWTEEGQNFAWRMMLHHKDLYLRLYARNPVTDETIEVPIIRLITPRQLHDIAKSPEQIAALARHFAELAAGTGFQQVEVRAVAIVSLNGRKPQLMFDPNLDLLSVERSWKHQSWIYPLTEPRREEPWRSPIEEWPQLVGIELPQPTAQRIPASRAPPAQIQ